MPLTVRAQFGEEAGDEAAAGRALLASARRAARAALAVRGVRQGEISITLLSDEAIERLNAQWLGHSGPTDVLSFPLFAANEAPVGDVYIGLDQARRQADALGAHLEEEVARLAIHGTLHVLGMDHPMGPARESSEMWQVQERVLATVMKP